jgi:hypothetical protein
LTYFSYSLDSQISFQTPCKIPFDQFKDRPPASLAGLGLAQRAYRKASIIIGFEEGHRQETMIGPLFLNDLLAPQTIDFRRIHPEQVF